jgi:hypothetical protein
MRNFKDIILEKLKITNNNGALPDIEEFKNAIYKFNVGHQISFDDVDIKYKELKSCPKYEINGKLYDVVSLFVSLRMNVDKFLYAFCSISGFEPGEHFIINSMDQLVEVLGEELVLEIWDYIR